MPLYNILKNVDRLMVMRELALLDAPEEPFFDRLTRLASAAIGVPVSLVTLVSKDYQFFKSMVGLPEPWASDRRTPLSHSFCQHVVTTGEPLVVEDAREVELLKDNLAIPDLDVIGYLGVPLHTDDGRQLGSFCVIDNKPHAWTESDIALLTAIAELVNAEIDARAAAYRAGRLRQHIAETGKTLDAFVASLDPTAPRADLIARVQAFTQTLRDTAARQSSKGG